MSEISLNPEPSKSLLENAKERLEKFRSLNLNLNMTRGKPSPKQLDLASNMLTILKSEDYKSRNGTDCRNYGVLDGLDEAKELFASFMEVSTEKIIIAGNSSLALMHDNITQALLKGVPGSEKPWCQEEKIKFICPVPGYDRHFNLCKHFGIEMISVALGEDGPVMDTVEALVQTDSAIKGMWCVPKYSNPTGAVYSDKVIERLANMQTKAADFRIWWDNAYAVHPIHGDPAPIANLLTLCEKAKHPNRALMFGSTSKISFAGAGVAVMAASEENLDAFRNNISMQTIGADKLNQLRHVYFFKNMEGIDAHMQKHADILRPKFRMVEDVLTRELGETGLATWTKPQGGYFVSLNTKPGLAKKVVALAKEVGVALTAAGATFPHREDPQDSNIRLAPSLPSVEEIETAMEVVAVCIQVLSLEG